VKSCKVKAISKTATALFYSTEKDPIGRLKQGMLIEKPMKNPTIRKATRKDVALLTDIIRNSFQDVAKRFGLTKENCPKHASNCEMDWIEKEMNRGVTYFILEEAGSASGCVALEKANNELSYLERLAVLPHQRKRSFGRMLVEHVLAEAKRSGVHSVSIGIIAQQKELKNWYQKIGFVEGETKEFAHLPFRVTFMSYAVAPNR
jgi:N-acetylglutamate synthase-like GNAT family acetyltransferase